MQTRNVSTLGCSYFFQNNFSEHVDAPVVILGNVFCSIVGARLMEEVLQRRHPLAADELGADNEIPLCSFRRFILLRQTRIGRRSISLLTFCHRGAMGLSQTQRGNSQHMARRQRTPRQLKAQRSGGLSSPLTPNTMNSRRLNVGPSFDGSELYHLSTQRVVRHNQATL